MTGIKPSFSGKLLNAIYAAALFSFTLLFFAPGFAYLTNHLEFTVSFLDILPYLLIISILCAVGMAALLLLLRGDGYRKGVSLVLLTSFFLWLKANVLLWNYGSWDGTRLEWGRYWLRGWVDAGLCLAALAAALIFYRFLYKHLRKISTTLIAVQLAAMAYLFIHVFPASNFRQYEFDLKCMNKFSSRKNVIILVIDAFRSDLFAKLINENASYRDAFEGFTFYSNALSGSSTTKLSFPLIFSGKYYDQKQDYESFVRKTCRADSLPAVLKGHQFRVELHNIPDKILYYDQRYMSNMVKRKTTAQQVRKDLFTVYLAGSFRCSPQFLKKLIYSMRLPSAFAGPPPEKSGEPKQKKPPLVEMGPLESHAFDIKFMRHLSGSAAIDGDAPIFKIVYVRGSHRPFAYDAGLRLSGALSNYDCAPYKEQAKGWLALTCDFLDRLKSSGIYDNSLILVISDHGIAFEKDCISGIKERHIQKGMCLITVKPFNSRGQLRTSTAPVCLADIPKTVMDGLGLPDDFPGISFLAAGEGQPRRRLELHVNRSRVDQSGKTYFTELEEYAVSGPADLPGSWALISNKGEK